MYRAHQTHYEQFGKLTGIVNIEEYGEIELDVVGVRDHSYGTSVLTNLCPPVVIRQTRQCWMPFVM